MHARWFVVAAWVGLGCGESDGEGGGGGAKGTVAQQLAKAACQNLLECRLIYDDASQLREAVGALGGCEMWFAEWIGDGESTLFGRDISKLTLQEEQLRACVDRFAHQCFIFEVEEPDESLNTICAEIFEGDVPRDGECVHDMECAGDAYCDTAVGLACDRGRCTPRHGKGEPCNEENECSALGVSAAFCTNGDEPGICVHATEISKVGANQPCGVLPGATPQEATLALCQDGLACQLEDDDRGRCVGLIAAGQPCGDDDECVPGAACVPAQPGAEETVCATFEVRKAGESCTSYASFSAQAATICEVGYYCIDERCARAKLGQEGESCDQFDCADGLHCVYGEDLDQDICIRLKKVGASCEWSGECESERCQNATCVADPCQ